MDFEAEYNNRQRVPAHVEIGARWQAASEAYRNEAAAGARLDVPYGPSERERYDVFAAGPADAPLVVYIHGGYWQRGTRKDFSFVARELNRAGIDVVLPSYPLCPDVGVMDIVEALRRCVAAVWMETARRPLVVGHSAGGHLAAAMVATAWGERAGVPADLVTRGVALSGVFDLPPLVGTSINAAVGLTAETARAASPLFWPAPPRDRRFVAAVGGAESAEFLRQAREIASAWSKAGPEAQDLVVPGADHFTIVDGLADPNSGLFKCLLAMARA